MLRELLVGLASCCAVTGVAAQQGTETIIGQARVLDGDTLDIGERRIRLFGIDAPEGAQACRRDGRNWACGRDATRALERITRGKTVTCVVRGLDAYSRLLAVCTADGVDMGDALVRAGFAWAFVKYSRTYEPAEQEARSARRGVFATSNTPPWLFRAARWGAALKTTDDDRARECPIKGNINRDGHRIYHLPWQASYARTQINERSGERWFCSVAEAERAGWRAAR